MKKNLVVTSLLLASIAFASEKTPQYKKAVFIVVWFFRTGS
ncbi:hypothetical protein QIW49_09015 [Francisellaceae bacterium CB300]